MLEALGEYFELLHFLGELIIFVLLLGDGLRQILVGFLKLSELLQVLLVRLRIVLLVVLGPVPVFRPLLLDHRDQLVVPFLVFLELLLRELQSLLQMLFLLFPFLFLVRGGFLQMLGGLLIDLDDFFQFLIELLFELLGFPSLLFLHLLLHPLSLFGVDLHLLLLRLRHDLLVHADFLDQITVFSQQ